MDACTTAVVISMRAREFWLTIPRATARADAERGANATYVAYDVTCAVQSSVVDGGVANGADASWAHDSSASTSSPRCVRARTVTAERVTRRRFREFLALYDDLVDECGGKREVPAAPKRDLFRRVRATDVERVEERRRALESWLWEVLASEACARSESLARFVRLGAAERALRRAVEAETAAPRADATKRNGADSPRTSSPNTATSEAEEFKSTRMRACVSDDDDSVSTVKRLEPCEETQVESSTEANANGEDVSVIASALTNAREEIEALKRELATTQECLNDARATASAANVKVKTLESSSLKEKKILSKEIRSLRKQLESARVDENERTNIITAEERTAKLNEVMHEVSVLRSRVQECTYEKLLSEEASGPHGVAAGDPNELLSVSDNRLACLLAETHIMILGVEDDASPSSTSPESAEAEAELLVAERKVRQTCADLLSDLINTRKSINSLLRKIAKKAEGSPTAVGDKIGQRVGNLIGDFANKLAIPQ